MVPHFLGVFLHTRRSGLIRPDAFFPPQKHQRLLSFSFWYQISHHDKRVFSSHSWCMKTFKPAPLPKKHLDLHSNKTATACIGVRQLLKARPEFLWGFHESTWRSSEDENFAGDSDGKWHSTGRYLRADEATVQTWWAEYLKSLERSWRKNRMTWNYHPGRSKTPTMRCALKRRKRWWMQLKEQPSWISMRFLLVWDLCSKRYDWLSLELVGWIEDLIRVSQRNTVRMDRIRLTGGLEYSNHVVSNVVMCKILVREIRAGYSWVTGSGFSTDR